MPRREMTSWIWLIIVGLLLTGCRQQGQIDTQYGQINGTAGGLSVNGTSVFADLFSERGFQVNRAGRISPRIDKYDTIVWIPDDRSCPDNPAIEAIEDWLDRGWERTFIYVGRDYNAYADYLQDVVENAPPEAREELLRRIAETDLSHDQTGDEFTWKEDLESCDWFDRVDNPRTKTKRLSGQFARGLSKDASVEVSSLLSPNSSRQSKSLLRANRKPFVYELEPNYSEYDDAKIIVVSNGSFLLNYGLVDQDNRILAGKLIDQCSGEKVLFLESGENGIQVSDSDTVNENRWAWIAQAPLRYIVPHFLMWGVLFCFVFFPIFGRPRESQKKSTSSFRNHVNALGKMIGRTDQPNRAKNKIRKYQEMTGDSKRKKD